MLKIWKPRNPEVRKRFEEVLDIEEKEERTLTSYENQHGMAY